MSVNISLLEREVERLVTAPYAPLLQDLYSLTQQINSRAICSWVSCKPCHVGALADVLIEGLTRSRFALPLIGKFARAPQFRNDLLERYPAIFDQLLRQAVERDEPEYTTVCVDMLSSPFPPNIITPASLSPFIVKMIERMRENPCAGTVMPIYSIFSCLLASPSVLSEIPSDIMVCFQTDLTKTLRNLDDHMGNLLCLAAFAKVSSSLNFGLERGKDEGSPEWLRNIKHFFGSKRGLKTLDLVVLRVILACSSNRGNLTVEQSAQSICLAIEICDNVEPEQRQTWITGNSIKIAKLCEKINRRDIDTGVQMLGLTFLVSLISATALSPDLLEPALTWILSENSRTVIETLPPNYIQRLIAANTACAGHSTISRMLDFILSTLNSTSADNVHMFKAQVARSLIDSLENLDSQVFDSVAASLSFDKYQKHIDSLIESFPRKQSLLNCEESSACSVSLSKFENELLCDFFSFYLRAFQKLQNSPATSVLVAFILRSKHLLPESKCKFSQSRPLDLRTSFASLKIRDKLPTSRRDWRSGMEETLINSANLVNDRILRQVESICYELEQRCGSIEGPLKAIEEERNKVSQEVTELKHENNELESQLQQASTTIAQLREEMSLLESSANAVALRAEELSEILEQTRQELDEVQRESRETISAERDLARTKELDLIATVAEKENCLEELQEEIRAKDQENNRLKSALDSIKKEKDSSLDNIAFLRQEMSRLQEELKKAQLLSAQKDEKIEDLLRETSYSKNLVEDLEKKIDEKITESEGLESALQTITDDFQAKLEALKRKSETEISKLSRECVVQKEENLSLQHSIQEEKLNAKKELQANEKRLQHLERKVQQLRDERAAKAREFFEAQQHISRLMGVMGFRTEPADSRTFSKQQTQLPLEPSLATAILQQTNTRVEPSLYQYESPATPTQSNTSHAGRRSPKRSRNNAFPLNESPSKGAERKPKGVATPINRSSVRKQRQREPLGEIDQNSQLEPFQESQFPSQGDENHFEDLDLDMELEFSKDDIFTSTAMSGRTPS